MIAETYLTEGRAWRDRTFSASGHRAIRADVSTMPPIVIAGRDRVTLTVKFARAERDMTAVAAALMTAGCGLRAERLGAIIDIGIGIAAGTRRGLLCVDATRAGQREEVVVPYRACREHRCCHWGDAEAPNPASTVMLAVAVERALTPDGFSRFRDVLGGHWPAEPEYREAVIDLAVARTFIDQGHTVRVHGAGSHLVLAERHETFMHPRLSVRLTS